MPKRTDIAEYRDLYICKAEDDFFIIREERALARFGITFHTMHGIMTLCSCIQLLIM